MQILFIHGGMTFKKKESYIEYLKNRPISLEKRNDWSDKFLDEKFPNIQIIRPSMPLKDYAKYKDWKIFFERYLTLLEKEFILIGKSLGGIFLAKYLSENRLPKKAVSTFLVCAPFDDSIPTEDLAGGFELKNNLSLIHENTDKLHLLFSEDDDVVPVEHAEKFKKKLPNADIRVYKEKNGHFKISEFPEIVDLIKEDLKQKN